MQCGHIQDRGCAVTTGTIAEGVQHERFMTVRVPRREHGHFGLQPVLANQQLETRHEVL